MKTTIFLLLLLYLTKSLFAMSYIAKNEDDTKISYHDLNNDITATLYKAEGFFKAIQWDVKLSKKNDFIQNAKEIKNAKFVFLRLKYLYEQKNNIN